MTISARYIDLVRIAPLGVAGRSGISRQRSATSGSGNESMEILIISTVSGQDFDFTERWLVYKQ